MYHLFILINIFTIITTPFSSGAQNKPYDDIDRIPVKYPNHFRTPELLAFNVGHYFSEKQDQIRASYYWITSNIEYDFNFFAENKKYYFNDSEFKNNHQGRSSEMAHNTLKAGEATCESYAYFFDQVYKSIGIRSQIIGSFTLNDSMNIEPNPELQDRTWNAYIISNNWSLLDVTRGAAYENTNTGEWGQETDDRYYDIIPIRLTKSHFPVLEKWQLLEKPVSKKEFFAKPILYDYHFWTSTLPSLDQDGLITINESDRAIVVYFNQVSAGPIFNQTRNIEIGRLVRYKKTKKGVYQT